MRKESPSLGDCALGCGPDLPQGNLGQPRSIFSWQHPLNRGPQLAAEHEHAPTRLRMEAGRQKRVLCVYKLTRKLWRGHACHFLLLERVASRHPVKASLRLAALGLDVGPAAMPKSLFYWEEEMAGFVSGRLWLRCRLPLVGIGRSAGGDEFFT